MGLSSMNVRFPKWALIRPWDLSIHPLKCFGMKYTVTDFRSL